jgi:competence protein ComEC
MHALAVSGTHVGLLYMGLIWLLDRIPIRGKRMRMFQQVAALIVIWSFAILTGATPSVLRATLMCSIWLVGNIILRPNFNFNVLAVSAVLLLFYNPYFLFHAGFQLSYAAVAGMLIFYPMLKKVIPVSRARWINELSNILWVGVAAQIGTLPLSLYYFHQFPCYFWLAGWVVVIGGAVFLWGGFVLIFLDAVWPWLAGVLGWLLYYLVWIINQLVMLIQHLPGSVVSGIWISVGACMLLYAAIACLLLAIRQRSGRWALRALACVTCVVCYQGWRYYEQSVTHGFTYYATPRQSLLDVRDGHEVMAITDIDSSTPRVEVFAAQGHRWAQGAPAIATHRVGFDTTFQTHIVWRKPPLMQLGTLKCAIVDGTHWVRKARAPISVDYLILSADARVSVAECMAKFPAKTVVFDATNRRKTVARWRDECAELGVAYHDLMVDGALEMGAKLSAR